MIGEADDIYTQTLLGLGRNHFQNKTILILGGGDGGLLNELLKHRPKFVLMAEISFTIISYNVYANSLESLRLHVVLNNRSSKK